MRITRFKLKGNGIKALGCLFVTVLLLFGLTAFPAAAEVTGWEIRPENPEIGDTLLISGLASGGEEVEVSVSFEKTVPVYLTEYKYEFGNIEILNFNNLFTVRAEGVENLNVKMKLVFSKTESAWANEGTATVSHSGVTPGKYKVLVDGIAEDGASSIKLKVTTAQKLNSGENGTFVYRYGTESTPSGNLEIKVGNSEKKVTLSPRGSRPSSQALEPGEMKTSGTTTLTDTGEDEKRSIYLTESSREEESALPATDGEVASKEPVPENETKEQAGSIINYFYLLAGILAGSAVILVGQRKK